MKRSMVALVALVALVACGSNPEDTQSPQPSPVPARTNLQAQAVPSVAPSFNYEYVSMVPRAAPSVGQPGPLLRPTRVTDASSRAASVAKILGLPPGLSLVAHDDQRGLTRMQTGPHRVEIADRSGSIRYTNGDLYNGTAMKAPPTRERALALADVLLSKLEAEGLLRRSEVLWNSPRVTHEYEQTAMGGSPTQTYVPPDAPRAVDTRVKYYRVVNGVPVSGSYIRFVFADTEELEDLRVLWRPVSSDSAANAAPVTLSKASARAAFESSPEFAGLPAGSKIEVLVDEYVYRDGSRNDTVNFLEPGYFFLYSVKTPSPELPPGTFVVGKKREFFLPATSHGETQAPSKEAARLAAENAAYSNQVGPKQIP